MTIVNSQNILFHFSFSFLLVTSEFKQPRNVSDNFGPGVVCRGMASKFCFLPRSFPFLPVCIESTYAKLSLNRSRLILKNRRRKDAGLLTVARIVVGGSEAEEEKGAQNNNARQSNLEQIQRDGEPPTFVSAPGRRIVAVGDLHGDLVKARQALRIAGVLSADGHDCWTGGSTVLVQLGDILDRGEDEIAIMSLIRSLTMQAEIYGGAVFQVNGNHETMNVDGDFRYVDHGAFDEAEDFMEYCNMHGDDWEAAFIEWIKVCEEWKARRKVTSNGWTNWNLLKIPKGIQERSFLFKPGGRLACELARHGVVLKVNDWVFCHGGLLPHHVKYGVQKMNKEVAHWMRAENNNNKGIQEKIPFIATRGYDSVVWSRLYSQETLGTDRRNFQICGILAATLDLINAKGMVVGHTPQTTGANCKCNSRIWRIDVGMSSGVLGAVPEVLEIIDDQVRVIRASTDKMLREETVDYYSI
ncbi:shewanella-like protein phosphatase 1 isoform X2 [Cryptomeria japonica]|uniref:shewanella-like protein phosphatase 1 isoform X2 n=1 Tax=Cryptomeria japonica TaxID=3369 RepID=UPI0025ACF6EA|nr:shewanella-like protein phosphatase 1 isoform X2 [Cryptomeria japonica]